jgi:hypothetical protein
MERRRRHFERKPGYGHDQSQDQQRIEARPADGRRNPLQVRRTRQPVKQAQAEKGESRGHAAEKKIF